MKLLTILLVLITSLISCESRSGAKLDQRINDDTLAIKKAYASQDTVEVRAKEIILGENTAFISTYITIIKVHNKHRIGDTILIGSRPFVLIK